MIPYDIDPSLHSAEPESPLLDDGFSPRPHQPEPSAVTEQNQVTPAAKDDVDPSLWAKSAF